MNRFNTEAVVLKHIKFKDSDRIYTLFSKDKGKISATAKGVGKITSKRSGNLDTLNHINVQISIHKSGQNYISEIETIATYKKIKSDLELSKKAFYLVEIINKVFWEDEDISNVFDQLINTLDRLEEKSEDPRITVNRFELKLMQLLGYEPQKDLLFRWRELMKKGETASADMLVKNFMVEILGEHLKSLELE